MKISGRKEAGLAALVLTGILLFSFYDIVFLGKTFKVTTTRPQALRTGPYGQEQNVPYIFPTRNFETAYFSEPMHRFIKGHLRRGALPFWDPHQGGGYPLFALMHLGLFFPPNWILYLFPNTVGWDIFCLLRFLMAGLLTFWFMRTLRMGRWPSFAAALVFMLSGPMVLRQHQSSTPDMLLPLILLCIERLLNTPDRKNVCLLSLAAALTILSGHAEHVFLVNGYGFCFFLFRLFTRPKTDRKKSAALYFAANGLALGVGAVALFPFLRNFLFEFWNNHDPAVGLVGAWTPVNRIAAIPNPFFFYVAPRPQTFIYDSWWGGYLGMIPLGLAFLSLFPRQKRGLNYFFAAMLFLIFSKSYGFPFINWLGYLPLFNMSIFYSHTLHLIAFSTAVLGGMGLRLILGRRSNLLTGAVYSGGLGLIFLIYLFYYPGTSSRHISPAGLVYGIAVLALFALILAVKRRRWFSPKRTALVLTALIFFELFIYIPRDRPRRFDSFPRVPYIEFLKTTPQRERAYGVFWTFFPGTSSSYGIDDLAIAQPILPKRFVRFVNHCLIENHFAKKYGAFSSLEAIPLPFFSKAQPYLDLLNVRFVIAPKDAGQIFPFVNRPGFPPPIYDREVNIYLRPRAFPRVFVVHRVVFENDAEKAFARIKEAAGALDKIAVIEGESDERILEALGSAPETDGSAASISLYTPNRVDVEAVMHNPGFLIFSDAYHPDWKVFVDGKRKRLYAADYLIRGVFLDEGSHQIRFVFFPWSFYGGAVMSVISIGVILFLLVRNGRRVT